MIKYLFSLFFLASVALAQPNILLLVSDDQRFDQNAYMPNVMSEIAAKGVKYRKAYITTPLCCPSRAGIFTGQYNSNNLVIGNNYPLLGNTVFKDFTDEYHVGLIGKYLNSHDGTPLPEFDYWVVHPYGSVSFYNQTYNVNGELTKFRGIHNAELIANHAIEFLDQASEQDKPWFLTCTFFAPHRPAIADKQDRGRFKKVKFRPRGNFMKSSPGKPRYINRSKDPIPENIEKLAAKQRDTIYSMDRQIKRILDQVESMGQTEDTVIIFISDNGIFHGEHKLTGKLAPYEEALRVPFFLRYDSMVEEPKVFKKLVANIDLTATLYDLAGIEAAHEVDGVSLVPTLSSNDAVRENMLFEAWKNGWKIRDGFYGIHTGRHVLILNQFSQAEFYDLRRDRFQLKNLVANGKKSRKFKELKEQLEELVIATRGELDFNKPDAEKIDK